MKYYKLTDQNLQTLNGFQWKIGKWYKTSGKGSLCSKGWLHCYNNELLAVLLNPIHADIANPKMFECECKGKTITDELKFGFTKMRIVKEVEIPEITIEQRVRFAILCALEVYHDKAFVKWAHDWLTGKDRTASSAAWAAESAARAVARAAAMAASSAAWASKWAAWASTWASDKLKNNDLIRIAEKAVRG